MKSLVTFLLIALVSSQSTKLWKKAGKLVKIDPPTDIVNVTAENDIKNGSLNFNISIKTNNQPSSVNLLIHNSSDTEIKELIVLRYEKNTKRVVASIQEICRKNGSQMVIDPPVEQGQYLQLIDVNTGTSGNSHIHSIELRRSYSKNIGKCGKLDVQTKEVQYKNGLRILNANGTEEKHDITLNYKSASIIKSAVMFLLIGLSVYLF